MSWDVDLKRVGAKQQYIVGVKGSSMLLVRIDVDPPEAYSVTISGSVSSGDFGAAWVYVDTQGVDHVYFAANDGSGVMEVLAGSITLDYTGSWTGTGVAQELGVPTDASNFNDGLSCKAALIPFPTCGDKNGHLVDPSPNAVTNSECNANGGSYYYNPVNAHRACKALPCEVGLVICN